MLGRRDEWDAKVHVYHSTPADDRESGIRRCVSCGRPVVVGAECMDCAMEHPVTAGLGWVVWGINQLTGGR
jgi:hypothetical protein